MERNLSKNINHLLFPDCGHNLIRCLELYSHDFLVVIRLTLGLNAENKLSSLNMLLLMYFATATMTLTKYHSKYDPQKKKKLDKSDFSKS